MITRDDLVVRRTPSAASQFKSIADLHALDRLNSHQRASQLRERLTDLQESLRDEVEQVGDPQLKALLETSAEVLGGLGKTFDDYAAKNEAAWR